ncbi:MAG TPA: hypothetical protein VN661_05690 [Candidatus Acidoferrales bacterium]|nr:hypothetical protein [Candidatus Acidoferrales bacterium]
MASKRKKTKFKVGREARRRARIGIGMPPPEKTIPDKREKAEKHKRAVTEEMEEG